MKMRLHRFLVMGGLAASLWLAAAAPALAADSIGSGASIQTPFASDSTDAHIHRAGGAPGGVLGDRHGVIAGGSPGGVLGDRWRVLAGGASGGVLGDRGPLGTRR